MSAKIALPVTYKLDPIPTPPCTYKALAETVVVLAVALVIVTALLVVDPRLVTVCSVLSFHTITVPVELLTLVSVPAVNVWTPKLVIVTVPVLALTPI